MARIITFSRVFPSYHPKAGQPTYFVEKFWEGYELINDNRHNLIPYIKDTMLKTDHNYTGNIGSFFSLNYKKHWPKYHTIRAGNRWKAGDKFSPRVWSGTPYKSKMTTIAPDIKITAVYDFEIAENWLRYLPGDYDYNITINHHSYLNTGSPEVKELAKNDGLNLAELLQWFKYPKPFKGQIICWNENIKY